jgi:hypothetical protein
VKGGDVLLVSWLGGSASMRVSTWRAFDECWPLTAEGLRAGELTVAVYSPRLEMNIGYDMVPIRDSAPGAHPNLAAPWAPAIAVVTEKPFIKRR